jgi:hypothetical protein
MAAGLGFKTFTTGEVLTAANVNGYLMQGVLVFASTAARDAAITSPQEGQFAYTKDTNGLWYYDGAAWVASGATGDIEGVTAGTGISGGGTSGTVTITNSMATAIDAKGDLVVGTGADAFSRLAVGATNGHVLTVDSAEATGLKYAAAGSSPSYAQLFSGSISGATTKTISGISGVNNIYFWLKDWSSASASSEIAIYLNGDTSAKYNQQGIQFNNTTGTMQASNTDGNGEFYLGQLGASAGNEGRISGQIFGCGSTGVKVAMFLSMQEGTSPKYVSANGHYTGTSAITSITFKSGTGAFDGGDLRVYGA